MVNGRIYDSDVTPCVGVWIEICPIAVWSAQSAVTPCVGVWIEIYTALDYNSHVASLPAWECGLKYTEF